MGKPVAGRRTVPPTQMMPRALREHPPRQRYGVELLRMRAVTAAVGSAGGVALSVAGLATAPGWLLVAAMAVVVVPVAVLLGLLLLADGPLGRFERILAALHGNRPASCRVDSRRLS